MGVFLSLFFRYAADTLQDKEASPSSRFKSRVDVTVKEMWVFFELVIAMGLVVIDDLDEYWSEDEIFSLPLFRSIMKWDRFCLILSFLHVCNNREQVPQGQADQDPLFKIRNFVTSLKDNFLRVFKPGRNIALDGATVAWRGPLAFRVYNPNKPDKSCIKDFELCDSATGYCSNLEFSTGKQDSSTFGATYDVVDQLKTPFLGCGRVLYVDNYYTSHDLFTSLKNQRTLACGTLRLNKRHGPSEVYAPETEEGRPLSQPH
ncbi:piggyBac transposable element-derived protein 4-like [Aplysia californica]|uniref:PiggyBac transposable element-derived protein 4-like n=1 Tax=Aplysia californica TaxID=6500 RepID=A0ABM0JDY6_APLCA|nr:piggyBac transposable element-derived protein 4-like [Aplysia californica]